MTCPKRLSRVFHLSVFVLWGLMLATRVHAQAEAPDPSDVLRATQTDAERCSGPLGNLLPECRQGKTAINISTNDKPGNQPPGAALRIPPSKETPSDVSPREPQQAAKPAAPTEFQRFVASSIGETLPVFGADLFQNVPTTFAPLDSVPVTSDYAIGPGDELLLRVWGQVNLDLALTVDRTGSIFIPQVGNIAVAGIQFQQLSSYLRAQLARMFRNFDMSVNLGQLRSIQIFVMGQARRPGTYTVSSLSTLVNALFASGGPAPQGSMRKIQLKRGAAVVTELDLYDLLLRGDKSRDASLLPGDVVYIPPAGPQVAVAGSVKTPGIYEVLPGTTADQLIGMAGGLSALADGTRAIVERIENRSVRESINIRLDRAGLATPMAEGDLLHVLTITPRIANAVTLRGNVANPGRFPWHAGMRIRDVIPEKASLVTREYWKKRNVLGFISPAEAIPQVPSAEASRSPATTTIATEVPDINWSYAVIERQNPANLAADLIPFHLGKLVLDNDESQNLELRPGDVVTIFSQSDIRVAMAQQTRFIRLEGEFVRAGVYAVRPGETLGQLVERAGGLTPQAYLFGSEFTRESTRVDQQRRLDQFVKELEQDVEHTGSNRLTAAATAEESSLVAAKLQSERTVVERLRAVKATGRIVLSLNGDGNDVSKLMAFNLEDGDRFLVPSRPATVNVLGAVYNQNSFVHTPSQRVANYLRQAGGPTRNADAGRIFIIRADGSVLPRRSFSAFSRSFDATLLNPGDSVIVPEAIFKGTVFRAFRDWTQVFSQFALGAAAINVLR